MKMKKNKIYKKDNKFSTYLSKQDDRFFKNISIEKVSKRTDIIKTGIAPERGLIKTLLGENKPNAANTSRYEELKRLVLSDVNWQGLSEGYQDPIWYMSCISWLEFKKLHKELQKTLLQ